MFIEDLINKYLNGEQQANRFLFIVGLLVIYIAIIGLMCKFL